MSQPPNRISQVFQSYRQKLANRIRHLVKPQDIDDIVQDTFVRCYEAELKQEIEYPKTYMLRTVQRLAINHLQRWDNSRSEHLEDLEEPTVQLLSPSAEQEFESKERFLQFCRAVEQLPDSCRKAFVLKKVYGLSQKEIAEYLQLSESTVEKHIAKGMRSCFAYIKNIEQGQSPKADAENTQFRKSRTNK
ncbi:RNA polymerase sigma factor [Pseudoteredinibacter isoporae]|uniref:RNA polymerase sigma-70 factor (ECF subfamily) n=1 Tax=Pseudoteredinibacter isoporae TaxID=570281 RepID=A0A7X0JWZ0_9GAMM|nr:RNA polymerase sigma factor [Pseudoteredinibacter isoporae]MBB6523747.1 RNA polymerase sigma-70 factor (ECF subfamily) [Pseudoteredinibacter isoporae]NHO89267.1 RNA polymerase sigma factor [Pseudoteredinibacter isoporae]NIB22374.1 RNA polymerase sigma factor [Pseudoteredinibacter isoporae]